MDVLSVPSVRLESFDNILVEGNVGVTIDGDVVVIPDGNQVTQLQVAGQ
jgi:hypothetical protein